MIEIEKLIKPYFAEWQTEVDITAVLKYIDEKTWNWFIIMWDKIILSAYLKDESIPNKPLNLYTEQEEKDLLELLLMNTKTLSLETSKLLQEKWLLDEIETEYVWVINWDIITTSTSKTIKELYAHPLVEIPEWFTTYKTLTLEEAIEFLPRIINDKWIYITKWIMEKYCMAYVDNDMEQDDIDNWTDWKTLLEATEKMINYLLTNNLL